MDSPFPSSEPSPASAPLEAFWADRVLAGLILAFQTFWFGAEMVNLWSAWYTGPSHGHPMFFDWIGERGYGPQIAIGLVTLLYAVWTAFAVARGHGWAFVLLAFTSARWTLPWVGHFDQANASIRVALVFHLFAFLYAGLRIFGPVGPRPADPLGLGRA